LKVLLAYATIDLHCVYNIQEIVMSEPKVLEITQRELDEIKHAIHYYAECNHGTTGHNQLVLIAKMATERGFHLYQRNGQLAVTVPEGVKVEPVGA
jgi:hypothetical protein